MNKPINCKPYLFLLTLLTFTIQLSAQTGGRTITGNVSDAEGLPLIGATVMTVGGTGAGTVTDEDGNYLLNIADVVESLRITYTGYAEQIVALDNRSEIDIVLNEDIAQLDQVVVVGYGTQKERNVISAVSTIQADDIERTPTPSFTNALQGAASGLQVSNSSGEPNAATRILIRGVGSITTSAEPLFIVDGIQVASGGTSPLEYLSPNDIASISVLKDAAATAIYGSRGANGVILITTKTGKQGESNLNFGYERGYTTPINELELADADEWRGLVAQARSNSGLTEPFRYEQNLFDQRQVQRYRDLDIYNTTNTDWVDRIKQDAGFDQYTISASSGTDQASYYISGQYRNQEGNYVNTNFERYTGRVNLDFKATDFLSLGVRYTYSLQDDQPRASQSSYVDRNDRNLNYGAWSTFGGLYNQALPISPVYWPDNGDPFDPLSTDNQVYSVNRNNAKRDVRESRNLGSFFAQLQPIDGLLIRGEVGVNHGQFRDYSWISGRLRPEEFLAEDTGSEGRDTLDYPYENGKSRYELLEGKNTTYNYTATANYELSVQAAHNFGLLLGIEALSTMGSSLGTRLEDAGSIQDESVIRNFIQNPDQIIRISNEGGEETRFYSQFGRLNYSFQDRYLLQASLRRDGSSKFTPEERFSFFPSVSAGWIVSDEPFLANRSRLSFLKVRAGWGVTGNANIGSFLFLDGFANWPIYPDRSGAQILTQLGSPSIKWEKSNTTDVAVEFGLFDNRVSGSLGYYFGKTTDLLLSFPVAPSIGIYSTNSVNPTALDNVGSLQNQGVELEIRTINVNVNRFRWSTEFNLTTNKNKVIDLYPGFDGDPRQLSFNGITTVQEGQPLGLFYLPEFAGYDNNGNLLVREVNPELAREQVYEFTGNDIRNINNTDAANSVIQYGKTGLPTFYGGLKNSFSYAGLSLDVLFTYQGGNYVYDDIGLNRVGRGVNNLRVDLVNNTWTPDNVNAEYPALSWANLELSPEDQAKPSPISDRSTRNLVKGDFIRLRNVSLSYQLPRNLFTSNFLDGARVYVNLNNVATFSKFDAVDPEVVNTGGAQARNLGQGVIGGVPYWQVFTASFGINIRL